MGEKRGRRAARVRARRTGRARRARRDRRVARARRARRVARVHRAAPLRRTCRAARGPRTAPRATRRRRSRAPGAGASSTACARSPPCSCSSSTRWASGRGVGRAGVDPAVGRAAGRGRRRVLPALGLSAVRAVPARADTHQCVCAAAGGAHRAGVLGRADRRRDRAAAARGVEECAALLRVCAGLRRCHGRPGARAGVDAVRRGAVLRVPAAVGARARQSALAVAVGGAFCARALRTKC